MKRKCERDYLNDLNTLADEIYIRASEQFPDDSHCWLRLARAAGLCPSTVYRLGLRQTKFPEARTLIKLSKAVGMSVGYGGISKIRTRSKNQCQRHFQNKDQK